MDRAVVLFSQGEAGLPGAPGFPGVRGEKGDQVRTAGCLFPARPPSLCPRKGAPLEACPLVGGGSFDGVNRVVLNVEGKELGGESSARVREWDRRMGLGHLWEGGVSSERIDGSGGWEAPLPDVLWSSRSLTRS